MQLDGRIEPLTDWPKCVDQESLLEALDSADFDHWQYQQDRSEQVRNGRVPPSEDDPMEHYPSQLLKCPRKRYYADKDAPREESQPNGLFELGSYLEEEVVVPYLRQRVSGSELFVANSLWLDVELPINGNTLQFRGSTDPVFVNPGGQPVLPTEVKSKQDLSSLEEPNEHHRAQLHAYMYMLSEEYDLTITTGVLLYVGRTNLSMKVFEVPFDSGFWENEVVAWASRLTEAKVAGELPPASPEQSWECKFCAFKERCGQGELPVEDSEANGFVPEFDYPKEAVLRALDQNPELELPPTLAAAFPSIAAEVDIADWKCPACSSRFSWETHPWDGVSPRPGCPSCDLRIGPKLTDPPIRR